MPNFKGLLHKIDSLELLKMKMKTKMTKKRKEMHEEEKEEEEKKRLSQKTFWKGTRMVFHYLIHHNFHSGQQE